MTSYVTLLEIGSQTFLSNYISSTQNVHVNATNASIFVNILYVGGMLIYDYDSYMYLSTNMSTIIPNKSEVNEIVLRFYKISK